MKLKVELSIGYPMATHEDVIDVDDDDYNACENDRQREEFLEEYWKDWANNYIDGGYELID